MCILIYTESENGKFKKCAPELASMVGQLLKLGVELIAASFNHSDFKRWAFGVERVFRLRSNWRQVHAERHAANLAIVK